MVAWFTVTVGPLAPMAMEAAAPMAFITVPGKSMGESPPGPRVR